MFICEWIFVTYGDPTRLDVKLNPGVNSLNGAKNSMIMTSAPWKVSKGDNSGNLPEN
jgi:hypothetical protein